MPDKGQRATDAEFRRLRAKVNDIYRQAYKEIVQKGKEFAQAFARREAQMRQQVADGKMTQADFDAWLRGQVFQSKQWAAKKKQMEDTLYHADQVAQSLVNDARYSVFAANANYVTQDIGEATRVDTSFNLYDANAVKRLAVKQPDLLPPKKKVGKDKSYKWYNRQVNTAITQGIIQGASIGEIARRIGKQTGESNCTAMLRNARTMFTGAQNAGRIDGLHQAQELGIRVKKQWMATPDNRTRDTHAELDGQIVDVDEPFITSAGNEIMYPGDPAAAPEEVWNCRCTLVYVYPDYDGEKGSQEKEQETKENEQTEFTSPANDDIIYSMREAREATKGIVNNERLYQTTPEIQAFTDVDSAIKFFEYTDKWGDVVSPIDKESFESIGLPVLKELSEGINWARNNLNVATNMPQKIKRASLGARVLGDYTDETREMRVRKGLTIEYAFSTGVHEMAHHADNLLGHPSEDIVKDACRNLRRNKVDQGTINEMRMELAAEKWKDPHEIVASSVDKYSVGKGNKLANLVAKEFLRRCGVE